MSNAWTLLVTLCAPGALVGGCFSAGVGADSSRVDGGALDGTADSTAQADAAARTEASAPPDAGSASDAAGDATEGGGDAGDAAHVIDDIAAGFSSTSNPNGNFIYGVRPTLDGGFATYAYAEVAQGLPLWQQSSAANTPPYVGKNDSDASVTFFGTVTLPAGTLWAHPGASGEYSTVRWTSPISGTYAIAVTFTPADATTTDVHVLKGSAAAALFDGNVSSGHPASYTGNVSLAAGDTLDFAVGYGTDGTYNQDSTGIAGTITGP
jgi:hypothetical protein